MVQLKTILLTTDFSENAGAAVPYAIELARKFSGCINLVHVFEDSNIAVKLPGEGAIALDWLSAVRIERKVRLTALAEEIAKTEKVDVVPIFLQGTAASEILNAAKANHAVALLSQPTDGLDLRTSCLGRLRSVSFS
jgi:nucleotide-binding universal stress UspA family protein